LSIFANYAIVFAQTLIKGKNYGVHPFLVQIKDKDYNWLPGIEGGDIGPKIGFHAKENGFIWIRHHDVHQIAHQLRYSQSVRSVHHHCHSIFFFQTTRAQCKQGREHYP
jgi:acyl-CoA oxidase